MTPTANLRHDAFLYRSDAEFGAAASRFAAEGLAAGEAVVAVTTASHAALLRSSLGPDAERVSFVASSDWYRRPPSAIAGFGATVEGLLADGASGVRVLNEIDFGATAREHREWARYEAVINHVFAAAPVAIVCPYRADDLPAFLLESACRTHPHLLRDGRRQANADYRAPADFLADLPAAGPIEDADVLAELQVTTDLGALRGTVIAAGRHVGLSDERLDEAVLAVNELVTNALLHGLRPVVLRLLADADHFYCEVRDAGSGIADPWAGLLPPDEERVGGGRGLWIAGQFSDGLEIGYAEGGTLTRVAFRRASVSAGVPASVSPDR